MLAQLWALARLRCPRCLKGEIFHGPITMNDPCPVCGLIFQREEGYFLGAMYASYGLSCGILVPLFYLIQWLLPSWGPVGWFVLTLVLYLPLVPAVFRYSRGIWIHFERFTCPTAVSATVFEKIRQQQFDRASPDKART
jgi:uncharacterized protein (DUF983 family)